MSKIETNIHQIGIGNPNPVKLGRCIKELERLYEIEHGGSRRNNCVLKTQEQLAFASTLLDSHDGRADCPKGLHHYSFKCIF